MTVDTDYGFINIRYILKDTLDKITKFFRDGIADRVRDIYRNRPGVNNLLQNLVDIFWFSAAGIHG